MIGKLKDLTMNIDGSQNITITVNEDFREQFDKLRAGEINVEIKKYSPGRSINANSYFWKICSEIGKAAPIVQSKEEVYRDAIRSVGCFSELSVADEAVEQFQKNWRNGGLGWFVDIIDDDPTKEGRKIVHAYFGSSTYTRSEFSKLINYVVQDAESLGIPTMTENEKDKLLDLWGRKKEQLE